MYKNLREAEIKKVVNFLPNGNEMSVDFRYSDKAEKTLVFMDENNHVAYDLRKPNTVYPLLAPNDNNYVSVEAKWMVTERDTSVVTKTSFPKSMELTDKEKLAYLKAGLSVAVSFKKNSKTK